MQEVIEQMKKRITNMQKLIGYINNNDFFSLLRVFQESELHGVDLAPVGRTIIEEIKNVVNNPRFSFSMQTSPGYFILIRFDNTDVGAINLAKKTVNLSYSLEEQRQNTEFYLQKCKNHLQEKQKKRNRKFFGFLKAKKPETSLSFSENELNKMILRYCNLIDFYNELIPLYYNMVQQLKALGFTAVGYCNHENKTFYIRQKDESHQIGFQYKDFLFLDSELHSAMEGLYFPWTTEHFAGFIDDFFKKYNQPVKVYLDDGIASFFEISSRDELIQLTKQHQVAVLCITVSLNDTKIRLFRNGKFQINHCHENVYQFLTSWGLLDSLLGYRNQSAS